MSSGKFEKALAFKQAQIYIFQLLLNKKYLLRISFSEDSF